MVHDRVGRRSGILPYMFRKIVSPIIILTILPINIICLYNAYIIDILLSECLKCIV